MVKIGGKQTRPNTVVSAASVRGQTLADKVYCNGDFAIRAYAPRLDISLKKNTLTFKVAHDLPAGLGFCGQKPISNLVFATFCRF